jgi:hypothetical protein
MAVYGRTWPDSRDIGRLACLRSSARQLAGVGGDSQQATERFRKPMLYPLSYEG